MDRADIALALANRLSAAEAAIDAALCRTAELTAALPTAWTDARLSPVTATAAFDGTARAVGALTEARRAVVDTHNTLAALERRLGLGVAFGPLDKPSEDVPRTGGGVTDLASWRQP